MEQQHVHEAQTLDDKPLLSNAQTIAHQPDRFILDFRSTFPQFNNANSPILATIHKVVLLDPRMAKEFSKALADNVKRFEQTYGEIKLPKPAKAKKTKASVEAVSVSDKPSYIN